MCFMKPFKREPEKKGMEVLLKIFLVVGIIAGVCIILKVLYTKYKNKICMLCNCDEDCDCGCQDEDFQDDDGCCCSSSGNTSDTAASDVNFNDGETN